MGSSSPLKLLVVLLVAGAALSGLVGVFSDYLYYSYFGLGLEAETNQYTYAMGLVFAVFAGIFLSPLDSNVKNCLGVLWAARCLITLVAMVAYESHYVVLDAFSYFRTAMSPVYIHNVDWTNGSEVLVMSLSYLLKWVPWFRSYATLKVLFSLFGLLGVYFFWRAYVLASDDGRIKGLWLLGLFPSIMFWTSILGKDPLVFFGLGLIAYSAARFMQGFSFGALFSMSSGIIMVAGIRLWMTVVILLSLAIAFLTTRRHVSNQSPFIRLMILSVAVGATGLFFQRMNFKSQEDAVDRIQFVSRAWRTGGSQLEVPSLNSPQEIAAFLPLGMFTSLFRPLPGEVPNIFGSLAGLENVVLLTLFILTLARLTTVSMRSLQVRFWSLSILLWAAVYSFISYQNLGTATRFKTQVLPFILILFLEVTLRARRELDSTRLIDRSSRHVTPAIE